jgi:hypothetical protein
VFRDQPVNYDPRERVIAAALQETGRSHVFLDFYHALALKENGATPDVLAVNVDAAGGAGEFLDHQDFGTEMDMRVPVSECRPLTRPREG